jgi:hypothetical protein
VIEDPIFKEFASEADLRDTMRLKELLHPPEFAYAEPFDGIRGVSESFVGMGVDCGDNRFVSCALKCLEDLEWVFTPTSNKPKGF